MTVMRLQRALARAGVASRRRAEELIRAGRVRVDGRVLALGARVDPARQRVTVDGRTLDAPRRAWFALHKPIGYVVSRRDPERRRTVFDLLPNVPGLTYVGRLDVMTSGLLLFTTDGVAAHRLTHPRYAVARVYRVRVHGADVAGARTALERGATLDGRRVTPSAVRVRAAGAGLEVDLTLREGRNRNVRRLAEAVGLTVDALHRVAYGPVRLGRLAAGRYRPLRPREVEAIEQARRSP
jgi:23S rRNA pseudouridine2605 synthase